MGTNYSPAPDVEQVGRQLIEKFHPHLKDVRVEFVFTEKVSKKKGKEVWGSLKKVSALNAFLAASETQKESGTDEEFFVLTIAKPVWDSFDENKRMALVDHYLCHGSAEENEDGELVLGLVNYDVEEFQAVIERHGFWRENVKSFFASAKKQQPPTEINKLRKKLDEVLPPETCE